MIFSKSIAYISSLCIHSIYCIMFSSQSLTIPELANTSRASSVLLYTTDSASSVRLAGRKTVDDSSINRKYRQGYQLLYMQ